MSKKKAFSGSTMTLKDFHGGSIPSDLPLPSAPGIVVRPTDRSGFDRQIPNAWGNRSDHRIRPGSSGNNNRNNNNYDEKSNFFTHSSHMGRNFDEDERKPLDGVSIPRRTVSDDTFRGGPVRSEPKPDSPVGRFSSRSVTSPVSQSANPVRFSGSTNVHTQIHSGGQQVGGALVPNAWGTRKEVASVNEPVPSSNWTGPNAVSRFAQASALEKVSSGRWQSKHLVVNQPDVEAIRFSDDTDFRSNSFSGVENERGDFNGMRGRYEEKSRVVEDESLGGGNVYYQERVMPQMYTEAKEPNLSFNREVIRPASTECKLGGSQMQPVIPADVVERPKIKLLPRSKPLETSEPPIVDYKQGYRPPSNPGHVETVIELHASEISTKPGSSGSDGGKRAVERPRLNLKPRSQPLEQSEGIAERERKGLFGGARPRELVLKERGVDDIVINNVELSQPSNRLKQDQPKTEAKLEPVVSVAAHGDKVENIPHERSGKNNERRDNRADMDKTEVRGSWRNENWRNTREPEQQQQQQQDWRPEPESWRRPAEQPNSPPPDSAGLRYGKAASAMELAQAFSRSNSGPKTADRVSAQRALPGRNQIPFSRLTDTREFYSGPTPRRQINGY
ncbi:hypothetical protein IFM89_005182 [Coptis chinensis]|uniref:Uncharacterized protein n=1 Tax=Coptis chinensis TaxID=261450 RepID=A0A835LWX8_9MAGN|nr:hypothetical protein IFM89_005182 [Coptis chinensis]